MMVDERNNQSLNQSAALSSLSSSRQLFALQAVIMCRRFLNELNDKKLLAVPKKLKMFGVGRSEFPVVCVGEILRWA